MSTSEADHPAVTAPSAEKNIKVKVFGLILDGNLVKK